MRGGEPVVPGRCAPKSRPATLPEDIPLDIVYEDADVLVINKPAGLVVHPGAGNPRGTLVNALLHFDPRLAELPRAGIVHRLDKDTSGLMVVARTLRAHTALVEQLSAREVHRQYLAVVQGTMVAGGTIDAPIGRHATDRIRQAVVKRGAGRDAITHYRVRETFPRAHPGRVPARNRPHAPDPRAHGAVRQHPLVGDPLYGGSFKLPKARHAGAGRARCALSSARPCTPRSSTFVHPITGETVARPARRCRRTCVALLAALRADTAAAKSGR